MSPNVHGPPEEPRADDWTLDVRVTAERVKGLYSRTAVALAAVILNSSLVAAVLWGAVSHTRLLSWLGTLYAVTLARLVLLRAYRRRPSVPPSARRWGRLFCIGAAANGLAWGASAVVLYPSGDVVLQVFLAFVLGGMSAGAAGSSATYFPAFAAFVVPALAPISIRLISTGDRVHSVMGVLLVFFGAAMAQIALASGQRLVELTQLQLRNRALASDLEALNRDLEARVADRTAALEAANRAKDEFLAMVSHELRTPLSAVLGWVHLLKMKDLPDAKRERAVLTIERSALAQAKVVEDLLDLSRVTSANPRLDLRLIRPETAVCAAIDAIRPAVEAKRVWLELHIERNCGELRADATRIQQIVSNLLDNAVKFTPSGGRVTLDMRRSGTWIEIVVSDSGRGMAPEFLPHAFDRFTQADTRNTRSRTGLGLGLAISQNLARLHGGTLEARSEGLGRGATFELRLPVNDARSDVRSSTTAPLISAATIAPRLPPDLRGVDVLLVEDDEDTREVLREIIERAGATATAASGTAEALACLRRHLPDVIVSDLAMPGPGGDGLTLLRTVRSLAPEAGGTIPAVSLTAHAGAEARRDALEAGFNVHMSKPVRSEQLIEEIARVKSHVETPTASS